MKRAKIHNRLTQMISNGYEPGRWGDPDFSGARRYVATLANLPRDDENAIRFVTERLNAFIDDYEYQWLQNEAEPF